jgi:hypothetical protein
VKEAKQAEPPSWLRPPLFMIGQDERGHWVVQELKGNSGGMFVSREAAMRYVRSENGHRPQAVVMVSGVLELEIARKPAAMPQHDVVRADARQLRRIA